MRRYKLVLAVFFGLFGSHLSGQVNTDSLMAVYTKKMQKYLDKDGKAGEFFSFTKEGIEVYVPATDSSQKKLEFFIYWRELSWFRGLSYCDPLCISRICNKKGQQKLNGDLMKEMENCTGCHLVARATYDGHVLPLRDIGIAIDPGHIAGDLETAKMEKKWVDIKSAGAPIIEGELALATALLLKKKLEAQGATVMLTRDKPNISSFGIDFVKWTDSLFIKSVEASRARGDMSFEEMNYLLTKATNLEIFRRFFLQEDLRERARKINEFHPDLTLIIHYNVDETNASWTKPTKKNFNMAFVGGSFNGDEFSRPEDRIEFLRLLLTDDIERSVEFSKHMVSSLVEKTKVPAALDSNAVYLKDNCMKTEASGVFCRNLTLTRKVKGVVCYGESLYQDNVNECKALVKDEVVVSEGIKTSKRVEEVAEAYYQGIMHYMKNRKAE